MTDIITYGIIIASGVIIALLIAYPLHFLWRPVYSVILSAAALIITNIVGLPFGFHIGVNVITILFVALLGVPGYTTLLLFCFIL